MARKYAAIMASLGMTLVMLRALRNGSGFESAILSAMYWMVALAIVGYVAGSIARSTVDESVRQRMEQELNSQAPAASATAPA